LKIIFLILSEALETVCIVFDRQPKRVDSSVPCQKIDDYCFESLTLLSAAKFIPKAQAFGAAALFLETINKLKKHDDFSKI
jgi:hypothetical protein